MCMHNKSPKNWEKGEYAKRAIRVYLFIRENMRRNKARTHTYTRVLMLVAVPKARLRFVGGKLAFWEAINKKRRVVLKRIGKRKHTIFFSFGFFCSKFLI